MRNLGLYRGKRKSDGKWMYGSLLKRADAKKPGEFFYMISDLSGINDEVHPETIGEFSGETLRGKDLYENDLVKMDNVEPEMMWVRFIEGAFCLCAVEQIKGPDLFNPGKTHVSFEKGECVMDLHYIHHAGQEQAKIVGTIHDEVKP